MEDSASENYEKVRAGGRSDWSWFGVARDAEEARGVEEAANAEDEQADEEELTALEPEVTTQEEEDQAAT